MHPSVVRTWPFIEQMLDKGSLCDADYVIADFLLRSFPDVSEDIALLLCHLSAALRQGHLCISITDSTILPPVSETWVGGEEKSTQLLPLEVEAIERSIRFGARSLPSFLCENGEVTPHPQTPLVQHQDDFYFQRYWEEESAIASGIRQILSISPTISAEAHACPNEALLPEQLAAIKSGCAHCLTVICGGPGTGKTFTASQFVKAYWNAISPEQQKTCKIVLAAPTGKAAAHLQIGLQRATQELDHFPPIQAQTLHALLEIRLRKTNTEKRVVRLSADLVIVDESSMIDAHLMGKLLLAMKPGARLLLIGDPNQLPPVATGAPFAEIIKSLHRHRPDQIVSLKTCLRAELKTLIELASYIHAGDAPKTLHLLTSGKSGVSHYSSLHEFRKAERQLAETTLSHFSFPKPLFDEPESILKLFDRFRILSPMRKGSYGVDTVNAFCLEHAIANSIAEEDPLFVAPIILTSNDHRLRLFNGEVGILIRPLGNRRKNELAQILEGDYALLPASDGSGRARKIPALLLPLYEYAYCLSVHKSQGSEFDHVLLLMSEGAEHFGREVLYTAVTRARKILEVWGTDETLTAAIQKCSLRVSGLQKQFI